MMNEINNLRMQLNTNMITYTQYVNQKYDIKQSYEEKLSNI